MAQKVLDALVARFGEDKIATESTGRDEIVTVAREHLVDLCWYLRDDPALAFDAPILCTCIDWLGRNEPRFEVVYQLRSTQHLHRIRIKVPVPEQDPTCPSLTGLWRGFGWPERECFDMYGIRFTDHADLRRIYLYEEFVGHPLRKDYIKETRQPLVRRDWSESP